MSFASSGMPLAARCGSSHELFIDDCSNMRDSGIGNGGIHFSFALPDAAQASVSRIAISVSHPDRSSVPELNGVGKSSAAPGRAHLNFAS